ncbi:MAG: sulfatase-like hydrolase/transferase [SAR202 cluster bacterium]|nr:sulfatase-like hydrolase/transferase [SAR202 cluster bacterium]
MASHDPNTPNILFILSDDQGAWAMGCAGNDEIVTPNLDRLASTGIRFESFFCASPVCSPARASILTGLIPSQHGVQDFLRKGNSKFLPQDGEEIDYLAGKRAYVEVLAEAGYSCGLSGKWHLGNSALPQMGFSYWNVHASGGGPYYNAPMIVDGEFSQPEGYVSDVITDNALDFLTEQLGSDSPFSLNVHYTAPHAPWNRENHPADLVR